MMKKFALLLLTFITFGLFAQETAPVETEETAATQTTVQNESTEQNENTEQKEYVDRSASVDVSNVGTDQRASEVKTFLLDQFNIETAWEAVIFPDTAVASLKYMDRPDKPASEGEKLDLSGEAAEAESRSVVLGAKIHFTRRAYGEEFFLKRRSPIRMDGITKAFSLWVCGRGMNHELYIRVKSATGVIADIPFENPKLNFIGWKQLVAYVPPTVTQEDMMAPDKPGFSVLGLVIKFNAMEMLRDYYVYFDDLEAYTDVIHLSQYSGIENMSDEW